jgi:hypothetical protein
LPTCALRCREEKLTVVSIVDGEPARTLMARCALIKVRAGSRSPSTMELELPYQFQRLWIMAYGSSKNNFHYGS